MASIVRYEPIRLRSAWPAHSTIDRAFDRIFQDAFRGLPSDRDVTARTGSAANLYESPRSYFIEVAVPAVQPDGLDVRVQENVVTITARPTWQAPPNAQPIWRGFSPAEWRESFTLPGEVNADRVEASLEHGVLMLELPKADHVLPRTIKVTSGGTAETVSPAATHGASEAQATSEANAAASAAAQNSGAGNAAETAA